ncbi:glycosyl hydrolase [Xylariales sp. AK1849]|nr:glycosyl hydrolase [Xylariales sp. AK1849]
MQSSTTPRILLFSKTAAYRHESIPAGVKALTQRIDAPSPFTTDSSEDASLINAANLSQYDAVVFLHTSGNFLDQAQLAALKDYLQAGGGFVGIHCAAAGMPTDLWYGSLVGAAFTDHPLPQKGVVTVEDADHVITKGLPARWEWFDEWYNFKTNPRDKVHVLMSIDEGCYEGGTMGGDHPLAWCHETGKSRSFYTSLGHFSEAWENNDFLGHVNRGILWAARKI